MNARKDGRCSSTLCHPVGLFCLGWLLASALGKTIRYHTYEEDPPGTVIGTLADELPLKVPGGSDGDRSFRLMKQSGNSSLVRVRERDGQLSLGAERLDREQLCGQAEEPCVVAFDVVSLGGPRGGSSSQYRLVHVELEVRDINDHAPRFPQPLIALEVSESAAPGTRLPLDLAHDLDVGSNGIQSFAVSPNSHFGLEAQSRADGLKCAELVLLTELDREAQAAYRLELVAKDGGSPARSGTATVSVRVLDANDNAPAFPHGALLTVELPEDAPPGSLLLDLDASDPDEGSNGQLLYAWGSQVPAEARQLFGLDPLSGRLSLQGAVDYELQRAYELDVQASDRGASPLAASCKVVVRLLDVNDNAPTVAISALSAGVGGGGAATQAGAEEDDASASTVAYVSEAAPAESLVALVSTSDSDAGANGQVRCSLLAAPHEPFALQRAYDASYVVLTTGALDRERVAEYNLTVVAEDLGSPPAKTVRRLTVRLADENDNTPRFAKARYEVAVLENNPPGAYLASVLASDPDLGLNGKVTYRLLDSQVMGASISTYVSVDPATGAIYALRTFNYEIIKQLELTVQATDGGSPQLSSATLVKVRVVDQNDNAPVITHPALTNGSLEIGVSSKAARDSLVVHIKARDADEGVNSELSFSFLEDPQQPQLPALDLFAINKKTGEVVLSRSFSEELLGQVYQLLLTVADKGRPPLSTTVMISFQSYTSTPSYSKEPIPPVAIWKGHSFNTISGREAEFSGKDSGKGDSDFNDSDSDISGDALRKDLITHMQNGLWACTAECKILGHSDRCWSPSCGRSNPHSSPRPKTQLSTFCKSTSLPRDSLHRDNYYQAQLPKTVGLQSVYEKVLHRDYDRTITLLSPPHQGRLPDLQEISVPLYQAPSTRYLGSPPETSQKV
ncbi:protocadherin-8 isoform X2 [Rhineura floridana]|uniref:protocadherin-8 isoform X2 n=1 Tax=Rhineura floridana TaxID=261503 RepID=UPI002AC7F44C|nr:protocadherin-8 isoform X2 [Rhineura floridana]